MLGYIDAHCHILDDEVLTGATVRGVGRFVVNAYASCNWDDVCASVHHDNRIYGAVGVLPWLDNELRDGWDKCLIDILSRNPRLMVGEIGLDKNRGDMEKQITVFTRQLQIASDYRRIAHIHCVGAWGKMMDLLRDVNLPPAMLFHCFSGSVEIMRELCKMNAYFSFGWGLMDGRHETMCAVVAAVDEGRILVESDAPGDTMPDKIPDIVAKIAEIRGVAPEYMANVIYENTTRMINEQSF